MQRSGATGSPYPDFDIDNNNITGYYNGISAVNTLSLEVVDNEVHMRQDNTPHHWQSGISITGTNASDIFNNIVDMSTASYGYGQSGIAAHTNEVPKIHCNSINNLDMSIRIDHDNTTASNDGVRSNYMQNAAQFGIWLVNDGELGDQAGSTGSNSSDNVWATTCSLYVYSQANSNPNTDVFFTRSGGGYDLPGSEVASEFGSNLMLGTNSAAAGSGTTCIANTSTPSNAKMAGAGALTALVQRGEAVALEYNQVTNFHANASSDLNAPDDLANNDASSKAIKRRALLSNIILQQIDVQSSPELVNFLNRVKYENTGLLFAVDSLIHHAEKDSAQIAVAQNANAAIAPVNKVEQSQQTFNALYLSYLAQHKKLNASETTDMEAIALHCPNVYGTAVYQARAVLFDLNKQQYRNTCENTVPNTSSEKRMAAKQAAIIGLNLFPNPASTAVYVNTDNYGTVVLKLYSIMGNLVLDKTVSDNEKTDIEKLSNGIYIYKLYHNDAELNVGKLIISH
ncbi:MAG: Secretion system C-terminal sorting domain [Bacteroidota bacterium]|jgi:hypothetical protein|nr:Secretion system C-terminal sorting domain [Bacteroidota bacterium]